MPPLARPLPAPAVLALLSVLASGGAQAQAGAPDPSFGSAGLVVYSGAEGVSFSDALIDADGSVLAVGATEVGGETHGLLVRLLADGTPDPAFGAGGRVAVRPAGAGGGALGFLDVAADGRGGAVVAGGEHRQDTDRAIVARLVAGGLDPAFGTGGVTRALPTGTFASQVLPLADGRLVVVGVQNNPVFRCFVARLTADGHLDASFGTDGVTTFNAPEGMFNEDCAGGAALADGRLVVGGTAIRAEEGTVSLVAVLSASGTLDPSFDRDGIATLALCADCIPAGAAGLLVDADGQFLLAGSLSTSVAPGWDAYIARMSPEGVPTPGFGTGGVVRGVLRDRGLGWSGASDAALQPDGKLVLVGAAPSPSSSYDLLVARRLPDGTADLPFGTDGEATLSTGGLSFAHAVAIGPGREIVVVGRTDDGSRVAGVVARFLGDGATGLPPAPDAAMALRMAPNPARGAGTLTLEVGAPRTVRLALVDLLGREVAVLHDGPLPAGVHPFPLPLGRLASGLYVARADGLRPPPPLRIVVARD